MPEAKDIPELLTIRELLGKNQYRIPIFQRNYAWGHDEIVQLIQDVVDYQRQPEERQDGAPPYYIGTLVVSVSRDGVFEVIDGQQRLTTLMLIAIFLRHQPSVKETLGWLQKINLEFESRPKAVEVLHGLFRLHNKQVSEDEAAGLAIRKGYSIIEGNLPKLCATGKLPVDQFAEYLLEKVKILRAPLPEKTDLNHYFEIMNNRGEQLEMHEVLKARLLDKLGKIHDDNEKRLCMQTFHQVWEACANMSGYVQAAFAKSERDRLFGDEWSSWNVKTFEDLQEILSPVPDDQQEESNPAELDLSAITRLHQDPDQDGKGSAHQDGQPESYHAVINFPNFLLQVLCVFIGKGGADNDPASQQGQGNNPSGISLDDKRLLATFQKALLANNNDDEVIEKVKEFACCLLCCRFLFDQYVIKRETAPQTIDWCLRRYKKGGESATYVNSFGDAGAEGTETTEKTEKTAPNSNRRLLMLQAAFHVSNTGQSYKHWLNAALHWLWQKQKEGSPISAESYLQYLESVGRAFVFDHYLCDDRKDFHDIIYRHDGQCQRSNEAGLTEANLIENIRPKLRYGTENMNGFIFNFLDYLLWVERSNTDPKIIDFRFTIRSSVEHMHPRNPMDEGMKWTGKEALDAFGNLCLVSDSKNSRLSNLMPRAKCDDYRNKPMDSIKQHLMFNIIKSKTIDKEGWAAEDVQQHEMEMLNVLAQSCLQVSHGGMAEQCTPYSSE